MSNPNKALGNGLENRVVQRAAKLGIPAARQPGSGVFRDFPNDVVVADFLAECKVRSRHPSYTEMQEWLEGVQAHAQRVGLADGILVYNVKGSRTPRVLLDLDTFLKIVSCTLDKQNSEGVQ